MQSPPFRTIGFRSLWIGLWALSILLCRPVWADDPAMSSVPLEVLPSGHIALKISINGKGPFRMILDTGSPVTLLSGRAAQRAGLIRESELKQPVLMGMRGQFALKSLRVGALTAKSVNVLVLDHPTIQILAEMEGPLDGILGFAFFSHYRTVIDYAARQISFSPITYVPEDIMATMMQRLMGGETRRVVAPSGLWGMVVDKPDTAPGVRISRVYPQSAAEAAGLKAGDRLLTLDGRWTDSVIGCFDAASLAQKGQEITVTVLREGKEREIAVRPRTGL